MLTTINISMPKNMYKDAKKTVSTKGYSSVSELVRDALRRMLYAPPTENGFSKVFEEEILSSATEPLNKDGVWKNEADIKAHFKKLKKRQSNDQS